MTTTPSTHLTISRIQKGIFLVMLTIGIAGTAYFTAMTAYWATREPLNGYYIDTSKKGKPQGVVFEESYKNRHLDIQKSAQNQWTVVVFAVLTNDDVGYSFGSGYGSYVWDSAEELGVKLTVLEDLLRESRIPEDEVEVWVVRVDPANTRLGHWTKSGFYGTCRKCSNRVLNAAHTKGGRYGNYFDGVYEWLTTEWFWRKDHIRSSMEVMVTDNPGAAPSTVILDPNGNIRVMSNGLYVGQIYTTLMSLMNRKPVAITSELVERNIPYEPKPAGWFSRFTSETMSFIGSMFMFVMITAGLLGLFRR